MNLILVFLVLIVSSIFASNESPSCGTTGSLYKRIESCSSSGYAQVDAYFKVTNHDNLIVYYNETSDTYFSSIMNEEVESNYSWFVPIGGWRPITDIDRLNLPKAINNKLMYTSSASTMVNEKFVSMLTNRSGDNITLTFAKGFAKFTLEDRYGGLTVLKNLNLGESSPLKFIHKHPVTKIEKMRLVTRISYGYGDVTDGLYKAMDIGMFFLFPITASVYGIYSLSYIPAALIDLVNLIPMSSYFKLKKFLKGKNVHVSSKNFELIKSLILSFKSY